MSFQCQDETLVPNPSHKEGYPRIRQTLAKRGSKMRMTWWEQSHKVVMTRMNEWGAFIILSYETNLKLHFTLINLMIGRPGRQNE